MAEIHALVDVNASIDKVWEIISDLDNEPNSGRVLKKSGIFLVVRIRLSVRSQLHSEIRSVCKK